MPPTLAYYAPIILEVEMDLLFPVLCRHIPPRPMHKGALYMYMEVLVMDVSGKLLRYCYLAILALVQALPLAYAREISPTMESY